MTASQPVYLPSARYRWLLLAACAVLLGVGLARLRGDGGSWMSIGFAGLMALQPVWTLSAWNPNRWVIMAWAAACGLLLLLPAVAATILPDTFDLQAALSRFLAQGVAPAGAGDFWPTWVGGTIQGVGFIAAIVVGLSNQVRAAQRAEGQPLGFVRDDVVVASFQTFGVTILVGSYALEIEDVAALTLAALVGGTGVLIQAARADGSSLGDLVREHRGPLGFGVAMFFAFFIGPRLVGWGSDLSKVDSEKLAYVIFLGALIVVRLARWLWAATRSKPDPNEQVDATPRASVDDD